MQINRLFEIVYILLAQKSATAKQLAEWFEVSRRTVYRDADTLSLAGIPIFTGEGKGGGISLLPDFVLNKFIFIEDERVKGWESAKCPIWYTSISLRLTGVFG